MTTYQAGTLQAAAHRLLQKYCDEVLMPYGITKNQWLIIGTIFDSGNKGIRITDLAESFATTLSYLTNTINLLESKGILKRNSDSKDERVKMVIVNPKFVPKCYEIENKLRSRLRKTIYSDITPEEFKTYTKVLYKLSQIDQVA